MNDRTVADKARLTRLLMSRGLRSAWRKALWPLRSVVTHRPRPPSRLLIAPQDIRTADPTVAADIYAGYFIFDGKSVNTHGRSPFALSPPSHGWAESLAGFGWLRHLRAADTALARVNARVLVGDWIAQAGHVRRGPNWEPRIVAQRLLAWLSQSPLILEGADGAFYRRFMRSIGRQTAVLDGALRAGLGGETRLFAALALVEVGLCAEGFERVRRRGSRLLVEAIGKQILSDGGHVSRNPGVLVDLLLDLLPLRQAFVAAGVPVPPPVLNAIDRMMPMVRAFRHGDGALALFNGMGPTPLDALATVLAYDDAQGQPLVNAPYSGYQRLEAGGGIVIVDTGPPPPTAFAGHAHAGTLAFEFSSDGQRIVVNCGAPVSGSAALRDAARATAAHSTLVLDGQSSCRFASGAALERWLEGAIYAGPRHVPVQRTGDAGSVVLDTSHDGYVERFGLVHRRRLALTGDGDLDGEDRLTWPDTIAHRPLPALAFTIRFHLHQSVRTRATEHGGAVLLEGAGGDVWIFRAEECPISIEDSVFFAVPDGARRIEQLVLRAASDTLPVVRWSLSRAT